MPAHIALSQYGDFVEVRITNTGEWGCQLIKWVKQRLWDILSQRLESLKIPALSICEQEWAEFTTNNLRLLDEIMGIMPMSAFLDTKPHLYIPENRRA